MIRIFSIGRLFKTVEIAFLAIPSDEDIYIRSQVEWSGRIPRYGLKSGPNIQFFETLRLAASSSYSFLNETDVYPLSPTWLISLSGAIRTDSDWVLGSKYDGSTVLGPDIAAHINGAAVYSSGNKEFQIFCSEYWRPGLEALCKSLPDTAYDIWMSRLQYMYSQNSSIWDSATSEFRRVFAEALPRFRETDVMTNLSLPGDFKPVSLLIDNGTELVHGRHFACESLRSAMKYASIDRKGGLTSAQESALLLKTMRSDIHREKIRSMLRPVPKILGDDR